MSSESEYNKAIFYSEVWNVLSELKDPLIITTFAEKMKILNAAYETDGGIYPTVEYVLSIAYDTVKDIRRTEFAEVGIQTEFVEDEQEKEEEEIETDEESSAVKQSSDTKQQVRDAWIKRFEAMNKKDSNKENGIEQDSE